MSATKSNNQIKIAVGVLVFHKDKLLLCRSAGKWGHKWIIPGGVMEYGETIAQTAEREIREETGLNIKVNKIGQVKSVVEPKEFKKAPTHFLMVDCVAQSQSDQVKLNSEHDRYQWVTPEQALDMDLLRYSRLPIQNYVNQLKQQDYLQGWKRCQADFENYQKRSAEQSQQSVFKAENQIILEIMPVLDNFHLAVRHIPLKEKEQGWVQGIIFIKKQLQNILSELGVSEIQALGKDFDPNYHECLEEVSAQDSKQDQKVTAVLRKGYLRKGQVIRPVQVKVAKVKTEPESKTKAQINSE
ncbi:MAG: nucleotide exchange factor GrpE [Candidatus Moranbacteria bacterium]|nr:nucleotide exchange factor GrpE [Candidatus Moranbacteria bacterium]